MNSNTTPKCVLIYFGFHYILSEFGHSYHGELVKPLVNEDQLSLLEILSFATNHYATGVQLIVVCNYKFGIVYFLGHTVVCATSMQPNVYNMDTCHKNNGLNLYILKLLYLIYLHRLYIIMLCTFSTKVNPILT